MLQPGFFEEIYWIIQWFRLLYINFARFIFVFRKQLGFAWFMAIRSLVLVLGAAATRYRSASPSSDRPRRFLRRAWDRLQLQQKPEGEGRSHMPNASLIACYQPDRLAIINQRSQIDIHEVWAKALINLGQGLSTLSIPKICWIPWGTWSLTSAGLVRWCG